MPSEDDKRPIWQQVQGIEQSYATVQSMFWNEQEKVARLREEVKRLEDEVSKHREDAGYWHRQYDRAQMEIRDLKGTIENLREAP